eukprot:s357_g12.t2
MRNHPVATAPALGAMIKAAFDFNYRQRLIGTAIKHCNSPEKDVRAPLVAGLQEMVESDQRLEGSKEAVLAIGRLAQGMAGRKAKADSETNQAHRGLHYELLQVLLHLPIGRADAAELAGPAGDMSNADEDVKKGLAEASITLSAEQLRKREGELLYEVFVVYLRILRQRHLHSRELMGTVLTGLARWGQQVNLELLLEILSELRLAVKDAIGRSDELVALHGLNCALVLLSGPSQALLTDVSWLSDSMTTLYNANTPGQQWVATSVFMVRPRERAPNPGPGVRRERPAGIIGRQEPVVRRGRLQPASLVRATSLGTSRSLSAPRGARRTASIGAQRSTTRVRSNWDPAPTEPNEDWCFAYYLASSLDIQALTENWKASLRRIPHTSPRPVIRFHSDVALLKVDEKDCFVFSFGCLVCWGCTPQEVEIDHLNIAGGDALPVCHKVQERIAIAYSLAQSVRLSFWEQRIDEWIAATRNIPEDMARTGRVLLSSQHVAKMMGELFALKNQVNLEFDTLDTPDVFWEFEEAEPIYVYARQHLDVDRRIHIVNHRFEVLEDMFDVLKDKLDERQGSRLTWIIIWLCALETVFSALKIIWTAGLLPAVKDAEICLQLRFRVRLHADEIDPERRIPEESGDMRSTLARGKCVMVQWHNPIEHQFTGLDANAAGLYSGSASRLHLRFAHIGHSRFYFASCHAASEELS